MNEENGRVFVMLTENWTELDQPIQEVPGRLQQSHQKVDQLVYMIVTIVENLRH